MSSQLRPVEQVTYSPARQLKLQVERLPGPGGSARHAVRLVSTRESSPMEYITFLTRSEMLALKDAIDAASQWIKEHP